MKSQVQAVKRQRHRDGTECLEGTQKVPKKFEPCCQTFLEHTKTCVHDIRYEWWRKSKT